MNQRKCIEPEKSQEDPAQKPNIDIFVNPNKDEAKNYIINFQKNKAEHFFQEVKMAALFPALFELLWYSSLPCTKVLNITDQYMLKSCEIAGQQVNCAEYFTKIPTGVGMCCALNVEKSLKDSKLTHLIESMRNFSENSEKVMKERVPAVEGIENGLKLV